ncbi:MAG TPA: glucose-6-phosphate dehydrogenase [Planctomycetota bacterium]|nr:glucose-6-phosphate dehydrogenase [Planctomycetota bacterium]
MAQPRAQGDALVLFGATGDLAHKKILPSLYALVRRGRLDVPIVGVAFSGWDLARFRKAVESSVRESGPVDRKVLARLLALLRYVDGDYNDAATFRGLARELGGARRPVHYLAIPPALFATVIQALGAAGLARGARVVVEKPFGRDLASARELDRVAHSVFPESAIYRIDHFLGKEAIENLLYFRFANSFLEPIWNRDHVASVQVTLSEDFGVEGRGNFYDRVGCLRDVVQNHMFQIVALLAMEPPAGSGTEAQRNEKAKVFQVMRPLAARDLVRGQFAGYRKEPGVARGSDTETYCALRLFIDSWRWAGVPWYLRSGKCLPETAAEVVVRLKRPPQLVFADPGILADPANALRFRLAPNPAISLAARVKSAGDGFVGEPKELILLEAGHDEQSPYERLLGDALAGHGALFTRQDAVEAAWAVLDHVLEHHGRAHPYRCGSWGPQAADALVAADGGWQDPVLST